MSHREPNYAMFPTAEYLDRVERARERMDAHGIDALIVTAKENGIYFSGIRTIGWNSKHRPLGIIVPRDNSKPSSASSPRVSSTSPTSPPGSRRCGPGAAGASPTPRRTR